MASTTGVAAFLRELLGDTKLVVADVGAANGALPHFRPLLEVATFFLFEPERTAYERLVAEMADAARNNVRIVNAALAATRRTRTLYVTNQRTGSSLLPVRSDAAEYGSSSYFYPLQEVQIETKRLEDILTQANESALHMVKIDVQGGELEVLEGLGSLGSTLLSAQVEVGMPGSYEGEPSFSEVDKWMNEHGLVLFDLIPAHANLTLSGDNHAYHMRVFKTYRSSPSVRRRIWYVETYYFRREDLVLGKREAGEVHRLVSAYAVHGFHAHAHRLAEKAAAEGIFSIEEARSIQEIIIRWHDATLDRSFPASMKRIAKRLIHKLLTPEQALHLKTRLSRFFAGD